MRKIVNKAFDIVMSWFCIIAILTAIISIGLILAGLGEKIVIFIMRVF